MSAPTTLGELKTDLSDWLLRTDLTTAAPKFIGLAEKKMHRDHRLRRLIRQDPFEIATEIEALPSDFKRIESLYLDGSGGRYGEIRIVSHGELGRYAYRFGPTGTPQVAAVIDDTQIIFSPVPSTTLNGVLTYWGDFTDLDQEDDESTNWVLTNHPDVYLFGSLVMAEPYLRHDERIPVWKQQYEEVLEQIRMDQEMSHYSGELVRRPVSPFPTP